MRQKTCWKSTEKESCSPYSGQEAEGGTKHEDIFERHTLGDLLPPSKSYFQIVRSATNSTVGESISEVSYHRTQLTSQEPHQLRTSLRTHEPL